VEIPLENARRKTALLMAALAVAAILIFQAAEMWLADYRLNSGKVEELERAAALMPGNGDVWDLLGRFYQWDFLRSDLLRSIVDYQKAVRDNPLSDRYWMDLAGAYEANGDNVLAAAAYEHAKEVYPDSAEVAFQYGNFLLRRQNYAGAFKELRRAVQTDRTLMPLAISRTWRATEDVNQLLDRVLPADTGAYLEAIDFFASTNQAEPALAVWERMLKLGKPIGLKGVFPFLDDLIHEDRAADAKRVWHEALAAAGLPDPRQANDSLIWDGDFQTEFSGGGLGWRWNPTPGTSIDFDPQKGPNGSRAVRLDFSGGQNLTLDSPLEYVPVEPDRAYQFQAQMRTDQITTESGVRFSITDPNHWNALNVLTDNFTGTRPWTAVQAGFTTGPMTHFVVVRLMRDPSRLFENQLGGSAWIADVSLVPAPAAGPDGAAPR
jgi:tetratricopeptide (TPR) repeat protein